jgi:hypothetical protein
MIQSEKEAVNPDKEEISMDREKQYPSSNGTKAVVSVSIPPHKRDEFYQALATLKTHHPDPFIQVAPLIVETVIDAANRLQQSPESAEKRKRA